jgi:segregation and condensation protein A
VSEEDNTLRQETEAESMLGPDVKTPSGIPRDYKPLESSTHALFRIELGEDFAGPVDLLLYLIKKHDLDVFDIPIKFITDRYLEMLDKMEALPIDIAAEFLVLAAELTHIKSKMLLPAREGVPVEADDVEIVDPREELVRRLLEYQKYRDAANQLADRDQLGRDVFARVASTPDVVEGEPGLKTVSVFRLVELMASLMKRDEGHHEIQLETVNITERIDYVLAFGDAREGKFTLTQLLQGIMTRHELVITFIAVLEMTRLQMLKLYAEDPSPLPPPASEDALDAVLGTHASSPPAPSNEVEDVPVIWVKLTGKRLSEELRDDYR